MTTGTAAAAPHAGPSDASAHPAPWDGRVRALEKQRTDTEETLARWKAKLEGVISGLQARARESSGLLGKCAWTRIRAPGVRDQRPHPAL